MILLEATDAPLRGHSTLLLGEGIRVLALACRGHHELAFENLALRRQLSH
jgi:predicted nuclease with RNAse H fold